VLLTSHDQLLGEGDITERGSIPLVALGFWNVTDKLRYSKLLDMLGR
jgi:hypothetical protein